MAMASAHSVANSIWKRTKNIGSSERLSYALVGDAVNLTSRIQALNKEFGTQILVSGETRRRLEGEFDLKPLPAVRVKGRTAEVEVYSLG
ncbi:MAG: adenylate/guanylate cyclase domain-containing protein [Betaproteobacteria bacterium]|nr:adenylate/guanylate cyclase domain-containing protein [Betaproteobacteria bacterium]